MSEFRHCFRLRFVAIATALLVLVGAGTALAGPVTVTITQIEQIGDDFDIASLGDFYARVTINGVVQTTFDDRFSNDSGYIVPSGWLIPPAPWILTVDVPFGTPSVAIKIELFDDDSLTDNDEADLTEGPGNDLDLVVDLGTGLWSGGVSWPQGCTTGPSSSDHAAALCFDISVLSATGDADEDGLLDSWELFGYSSGFDAALDVDLPTLGANALRKDLFVELDCLVAGTHSHCPRLDAIDDAVAAFARAPVLNPDGTSGVQLHVDVGALFGSGMVTAVPGTGGVMGNYGDLGNGNNTITEAGNEIIEAFGDSMGPGTKFDDLRADFFDGARRGSIFRYGIFGHQTNARAVTDDCTSGMANGIPSRSFMVTLGGVGASGNACYLTDANGFSVGSRMAQAGTFLHEVGHTLGLGHGGLDGVNRKPNYLSVMSYAFQSCGVPASPDATLPGGCDYSRLDLADLDETSLDECIGLDSGQLGFGPADWDQDGVIQGTTACQGFGRNVEADINNDGTCVKAGADNMGDSPPSGDDITSGEEVNDGPNRVCNTAAMGDDVQSTPVGSTPAQDNPLEGHDDWNNLEYSLMEVARLGSSGSEPVTDEPDPQTIAESRQFLSTMLRPDVSVVLQGPPTAIPGDVLAFTVDMTNSGRGPALDAVLTDTAPDGTAHDTSVGAIVVGNTRTGSSTFTVPDDACPGDLTSSGASVAFKDIVGNAMSAGASTPLEILDVAAPTISVSVSPQVLWPPNHKFVTITATLTVEDNCDPNPAITLVSITSNEPEEGFLGQGDRGPDIAGAVFGTDDRVFSLRSERGTGHGAGGRSYVIVYSATDVHGNTSESTATVTVPTSQGH